MPIVIALEIGLQLFCAVHAVRTGRPYYWLMIILAIPLFGSVAYLVTELVPDLMRTRAARQAASNVTRFVDPDRDFRTLVDQLDTADTADNKRALAEECVRRGQWADAVKLYQSALAGPHRDDPVLMVGLARAYFAGADFAACTRTLDRLRAANPEYQSAEAHLLYARGLEGEGRDGEALAEYAAVSAYYPGEEAKCRHALLLLRLGEAARARDAFGVVARSVDKGSAAYRRAQWEWYEIARQNLG